MMQTKGKGKNRHFDDPKYVAWRQAVYQRDGFKCQMPNCRCGGKGYLNAHHIIRWADAPKLRYDVNNGITLCYHAHESVTGKENEYVVLFTKIVSNNAEAKRGKKRTSKVSGAKRHQRKRGKGVGVYGKRKMLRDIKRNSRNR